MGLCGSSSDDEKEIPEFDTLPRGLAWRLKFSKKKVENYPGRSVIRLGTNRVIKRGSLSTEYEALRMVDRHTSVPIPKVLGVYNLRDGLLVEYEAFPGRTLETRWSELAGDQRRKIVADLGRFVDQLRKIDPPKHVVVGSATFGAAFDRRFGGGRIGPFYTLAAFHDYIRRGHSPAEFEEESLQLCHAKKEYELKFTHASLHPGNVLLDDSGRISCIIGWESAGWYPEYWEYTQMYCNTPPGMRDWFDAMKKVMPKTYDEEIVAEEVLRKRFHASVYGEARSVRAPSPSPSELQRERREIDDKNTESTSG